MVEPTVYPLLSVLLLTALAAAWDLYKGEIPNRLIAIGASVSALSLLVSSLSPAGAGPLRTLAAMFAGLVFVSIVPGLLYRSGGIGGGDVKLLAVVGATLGPLGGLEVELFAFLIAALYAPIRLIWDGKLVQSLKTIGLLVVRPLIPRQKRPAPVLAEELTALRFGPAIFAGALLTAIHHLGSLR